MSWEQFGEAIDLVVVDATETCLLMTALGVGVVVALSFRSAVDDPGASGEFETSAHGWR